MKFLAMLGILTLIVSIFGVIPMAEAHPHATIDLMESHSHDVLDDNFQEELIENADNFIDYFLINPGNASKVFSKILKSY